MIKSTILSQAQLDHSAEAVVGTVWRVLMCLLYCCSACDAYLSETGKQKMMWSEILVDYCAGTDSETYLWRSGE